jgi:hypothetical protein
MTHMISGWGVRRFVALDHSRSTVASEGLDRRAEQALVTVVAAAHLLGETQLKGHAVLRDRDGLACAGVANPAGAARLRSWPLTTEPGLAFVRNVFNRAVAFLARHRVSLMGSRVLAVRGHASGARHTTPTNLLDHDGHRYPVSVRGHGHWVRNLHAAGTGELRLGKHVEAFRSRELINDEKVPVLRAYLERWKAEVAPFFDGIGPESSDDRIRAIAADPPCTAPEPREYG